METSDWAKNLAERKKKELEEKRIKEHNLHAQLDKKWAEVCRAAQKATEELNKEMSQQYVRFSRDANADKFSLKVGETDNVVRLDRPNCSNSR